VNNESFDAHHDCYDACSCHHHHHHHHRQRVDDVERHYQSTSSHHQVLTMTLVTPTCHVTPSAAAAVRRLPSSSLTHTHAYACIRLDILTSSIVHTLTTNQLRSQLMPFLSISVKCKTSIYNETQTHIIIITFLNRTTDKLLDQYTQQCTKCWTIINVHHILTMKRLSVRELVFRLTV